MKESGGTTRRDMMHHAVGPGGDGGSVGPFLLEVGSVSCEKARTKKMVS